MTDWTRPSSAELRIGLAVHELLDAVDGVDLAELVRRLSAEPDHPIRSEVTAMYTALAEFAAVARRSRASALAELAAITQRARRGQA